MYIYISKFCLPFKKKNTPHKLLSLLLNNPKKKNLTNIQKKKKINLKKKKNHNIIHIKITTTIPIFFFFL